MSDEFETTRFDIRQLEALREESEDPAREPTWGEVRGLLKIIDWHEKKHEELTTRLSNIRYESDPEWSYMDMDADDDLIQILGDDDEE